MDNAGTLTTSLSAMLTPTITVAAAGIAYQQWKVARTKLMLDLFKPRLQVYSAARTVIALILINARLETKEELAFLNGISDVKWLFNDDIASYLDGEFRQRMYQFGTMRKELDALPPESPERNANSTEFLATMRWFQKQYGVLDKKFEPFLRLKH